MTSLFKLQKVRLNLSARADLQPMKSYRTPNLEKYTITMERRV